MVICVAFLALCLAKVDCGPWVGQNKNMQDKNYVEIPALRLVEKFAVRLRELRAERGLTTRDLATHVGMAKSSVTRWENNQSVIQADQLIRLAQFFNVRVGYLLGVEEE